MNFKGIKGRQKAFAERVAEGHTATEAYLLAGYRAAKRETAHRAASRLHANSGIRAYIRELRRTGDELAREETTLTIAKKLAFLARLVLTSSAALREDDPLIQSHRILKDGTTSIRIPCKLKALKMHSELAGHFLPEPQEQPIPTDPLQELFDQIRRGKFNEPTPQPATPPKSEHTLPKLEGRDAAPSGSHISRNAQPPTPPVPRANANPSPEQISNPQQTIGLQSQRDEARKRHDAGQLDRIGLWRPPVLQPPPSLELSHSSDPLHTTTFTEAFCESEKTRTPAKNEPQRRSVYQPEHTGLCALSMSPLPTPPEPPPLHTSSFNLHTLPSQPLHPADPPNLPSSIQQPTSPAITPAPPLHTSSFNLHTLPPHPLRPVDVRRMVLAEIHSAGVPQERSTEPSDPATAGEPEAPQFVPTGTNWPSAPTTALHNAHPIPIYDESPRPLTILR